MNVNVTRRLLLRGLLAGALAAATPGWKREGHPGKGKGRKPIPPINDTVGTPTSPATVHTYPGKPPADEILVGMSTANNGINQYGIPVRFTRVFFQPQHVGAWDVRTYDEHWREGVPLIWTSYKLPDNNNWKAVAEGQYDLYINAIGDSLATAQVPVWCTIHHEPDGGGGSGSNTDRPDLDTNWHWQAVKRFREVLAPRTDLDHVAWLPVLMGWSLEEYNDDTNTQIRDPDLFWPVEYPVGHPECPYDLLGYDHYTGDTYPVTLDSRPGSTYNKIAEFGAARNADVAIGEWGTESYEPEVMKNILEIHRSLGFVGSSYWDNWTYNLADRPEHVAWLEYYMSGLYK